MTADRTLRVAALVALLFAGAAEAAGPLVLAKGDSGDAVAADSALLLLAIESELPVEAIKLQTLVNGRKKRSFEVPLKPSSKYSAAVVVLAPGTYRLEWLKLSSGRWKLEDQASFELKTGSVNYLGDLGLNDRGRGLRFTVSDRSGRARVWLQENHGGLLARFGLRYAGTDDDGWTETLR